MILKSVCFGGQVQKHHYLIQEDSAGVGFLPQEQGF